MMTREGRREYLIVGLILAQTLWLVGGAWAQGPKAGDTSSLRRLLKTASRKHSYQPASALRLRQLQALFESTMVDEFRFDVLKEQWNSLGWTIRELTLAEQTVYVIHESEVARSGSGFYALRPNSSQGIIIQAPHSFADLNTRDIARRLFELGWVRGAAWNTVHRKKVDVAHTRRHTFNAFMQAALSTQPDSLFVQLHGFAKEKRDTVAGAGADLIVSDGTRTPKRWVRQAASQLQIDLPDFDVKLYPYDVRELGALRNAQSQLLRQLSSRRFLHLEMSSGLRRQLRESTRMQSELLKDLEKIYRFSKR